MRRLDQQELTLRMIEAAVGFKRPDKLTAEQALEYAPEHLRRAHARAAVAAILYFIECAGPLTILPEKIIEDVDPTRTKVSTVLHKNGSH